MVEKIRREGGGNFVGQAKIACYARKYARKGERSISFDHRKKGDHKKGAEDNCGEVTGAELRRLTD